MMEKKQSSTGENQKGDPPKIDKEDELRKQTREAAEKAAKAGRVSRLMVQIKQRVGIAECTKLEPGFENNIDKLIFYHNAIFHLVDCIELQIQVNPTALERREVAAPLHENPWEVLGGWLNYMAQAQFEAPQSRILVKYSHACGKIARKEVHLQNRTRTVLIRKMRLYIGDVSEALNKSYEQLKMLLPGIDDARHHLKSASTTKEVRARGEAYLAMIRAFNEKGNEIQGWCDELVIIVTVHMNELLHFAKELSIVHAQTFNALYDAIHHLGYQVPHKRIVLVKKDKDQKE
uniref:BAR domain-containing protein n=2 Tax=Caenorhabditis japonica TaxID=281687 RepID=A0A8R1DJ80_CAEJA